MSASKETVDRESGQHEVTCGRWFQYDENHKRYIPDAVCTCGAVQPPQQAEACLKCDHERNDPRRRCSDQYNSFCILGCGCDCVFTPQQGREEASERTNMMGTLQNWIAEARERFDRIPDSSYRSTALALCEELEVLVATQAMADLVPRLNQEEKESVEMKTASGEPKPKAPCHSENSVVKDSSESACVRNGCNHSEDEHVFRHCTIADCDCRKFVGKEK